MGVISAAQIAEAGFLPGLISYVLKASAIDKFTRDASCSPEVCNDEFASIPYRWRKYVLLHDNPLYLVGLLDRMSYALDATAPP